MAISLAHKSITVDVNDRNAPNVVGIVNVNDKATRYLDVTLTASGEKLTFTGCTATATFVTDGYLISDSVACTLNSTADVITVPLENFNSTSGFLAIEIKIANGEMQVLNTPLTLKVMVTPSLAENSKINNKSAGSFVEISREVATARGGSNSLGTRLDTVDTNLAKKADKTNTLAGYGIINAYTKTETLNLLAKKADVNSVYSKTETDNSLQEKADKAEVTNHLSKLKEDLGEQQTEYNGMIKFQQGVIDGNEVKYNKTRVAVTELPQKWVSVTASDGYDIRAAVYNASGALLGYNLSENVWSERTIFKSALKQLYPDFSYAWLQIRKNDNSSMTLNDATKSISFILFPLENKNYINALEYGFYNYGNISNDDVMRKYLENDSEKELYFPNGTYLFTKTIDVTNGCKIRMDDEAELKLSADVGNIGGHFFIFGDKSKMKRGSYIIGGRINADFGTASVVCLDSIQSARIENCTLKNANHYGIQTGRTQDLRASDFYMHGCRIVNEKYVQGAIGIYDNAYDNSFDNVTIVDFPIGIETASSKFNRVHAWLSSATFIPNSIGIILDNNPSCFTNCTIDTYHRGVVSRGNEHYEFNAVNFTYFLNTNVYTKEIAATNPPIVFHKVVMSESFTSLPILHCHGITINETGYDVKLADFKYPEDLLKKIWCSGVTQNENIINDSFTAEKRLSALGV